MAHSFAGITFSHVDDKGKADWTGCTNIKLLVFENTRRFQHYIDSFNVQTNHWVAEYVFKRLRFLGNRTYSQLGALAFLALWHGFHSGYYMCFVMEFLVMVFEREVSDRKKMFIFWLYLRVWPIRSCYFKFDALICYCSPCTFQMEPVFTRSDKFQWFANTTIGGILIWIALKLYTIIGMGWCLAPLALLSWTKWVIFYKSLWFFGFLLWLPWPIYKPILKLLLGSSKKTQ